MEPDSGVVYDNPYQHATSDDRVQAVTVQNTLYEQVQPSDKERQLSVAEDISKTRLQSQTIIKVAILLTIILLLFGLALGGILLVSQEKLRLDETKKESLQIKSDMQKEQLEVNETWMKKISALESQIESMQSERSALMGRMSDLSKRLSAQEKLYNKTYNKVVEGLDDLWIRAGWYKASNGFYYKIFKDEKTYMEARELCKGKSARLASTGFRDLGVREQLIELIRVVKKNVWIGATDTKTEGTFVWEDGVTSNGSDINWSAYQPNNYRGKEHCAIYWCKNDNWFVNDNNCEDDLAYMCEKEVNYEVK